MIEETAESVAPEPKHRAFIVIVVTVGALVLSMINASIIAVAIAFAIAFIVFVLVTDQIIQRKTVVRSHEIDTVIRMAATALIQVAGSRHSSGKRAEQARIA